MCDALIPAVGIVKFIRTETVDTKTFFVESPSGGKCFDFQPGQCAMLGIPGVGEAMFSISSSPTNATHMEFSIKSVGKLTSYLHKIDPDTKITIRGPYGRPFPVESDLLRNNLLFIGGGIGLAPLRSVIKYVLDKRDNYGEVDIVYGARSAGDIVFADELKNEWIKNTNVHVTIDKPQDGWHGHIGFVPSYLQELSFDTNRTAIICGPPIMIKYALEALVNMGFTKEQVYTTLEMKMKCGIGKCGRCNIGHKYICKNGPVFRCDELENLPEEH